MKDTSKYDAVLICNINEMIPESYGDSRSANRHMNGKDGAFKGDYWYDDPSLYANNAFGKMMSYDLNGWKRGYSANVTDFGKWVVVDVTYHNHITGRSASKTFLVVFDGGPKGNDPSNGMVLTTANKYRTISGYGQAVTYIKSASSALEYSTEQKI